MLQFVTKTGVITDTKYDYTALIVNNNRHIVIAISMVIITAFLTTSEIMYILPLYLGSTYIIVACGFSCFILICITDLASLVHIPHSLLVQMSGPVSLVHMPHSLSVQMSDSAWYPPPHTLQLLAAVLVCLVLA